MLTKFLYILKLVSENSTNIDDEILKKKIVKNASQRNIKKKVARKISSEILKKKTFTGKKGRFLNELPKTLNTFIDKNISDFEEKSKRFEALSNQIDLVLNDSDKTKYIPNKNIKSKFDMEISENFSDLFEKIFFKLVNILFKQFNKLKDYYKNFNIIIINIVEKICNSIFVANFFDLFLKFYSSISNNLLDLNDEIFDILKYLSFYFIKYKFSNIYWLNIIFVIIYRMIGPIFMVYIIGKSLKFIFKKINTFNNDRLFIKKIIQYFWLDEFLSEDDFLMIFLIDILYLMYLLVNYDLLIAFFSIMYMFTYLIAITCPLILKDFIEIVICKLTGDYIPFVDKILTTFHALHLFIVIGIMAFYSKNMFMNFLRLFSRIIMLIMMCLSVMNMLE